MGKAVAEQLFQEDGRSVSDTQQDDQLRDQKWLHRISVCAPTARLRKSFTEKSQDCSRISLARRWPPSTIVKVRKVHIRRGNVARSVGDVEPSVSRPIISGATRDRGCHKGG